MALSVDIFMFSLSAQFFNRSFPLHLGIKEEEEVQKTSRKISVNRQSEAEKKKECVFQRLSVGSVRMSVDGNEMAAGKGCSFTCNLLFHD